MNILIIGSGGREHALGWKIKQSPLVKNLYFAPGNGGTASLGTNVAIPATDIASLLKFAKQNRIDLTVVGPDDPLALGMVDIFQKYNLTIFGPRKKAARLEWDKSWTAKFLEKYNIPHPFSKTFNDIQKAKQYAQNKNPSRIVIKASGLALGKGVILPESLDEAYAALERMMIKREFGDAGRKVVIQERLEGQEISIHAFSDGNAILPFLPSQDHKRIFDNDRGPNTGGMGTYAPVPFVSKSLLNEIIGKILLPTINGMRQEGVSYTGLLYPGLMLTKTGPKVLEFNCRFGDPETQSLMMLLQTDLLQIMIACTNQTLTQQNIRFRKGSAVCVIAAAKGYPGSYEKGKVIHGIEKIKNKDICVFHAGTVQKGDIIQTNGGRVLGVTSFATSFVQARKNAYSALKKISFAGMQYRKDIGLRASNKL